MENAIQQLHRAEWADYLWDESLVYIKSVVETAHNPFLILDSHMRVLVANKLFYKLFRMDEKNPEPRYVNEIGNGVWNVHVLGALLSGILPKNISFKGIEVSSEFPSIGKKIMLLNGKLSSPIVVLTMEDSVQMTIITAELADCAARIKGKMYERTEILEREVQQLKKQIKLYKHGKH